jgi:hypothetical protein
VSRAVIVSPLLPQAPVTGGQKRTRRLLEAMERAGPRPYVLTPDPGYAYGQAVVDGVSGRDPRPAAQRLNPLEPLARTLVRARDPAGLRDVASRAGIPFG